MNDPYGKTGKEIKKEQALQFGRELGSKAAKTLADALGDAVKELVIKPLEAQVAELTRKLDAAMEVLAELVEAADNFHRWDGEDKDGNDIIATLDTSRAKQVLAQYPKEAPPAGAKEEA